MNNDKNKNQQSDLTDKNQSNKSDISNSLERDAVGNSEDRSLRQTPQNRTDNEQDEERQK